jgi:hypothetical protein
MRKRRPTGTTLGLVFVSALLAVAALTAGPASAGKPLPTLTCTAFVNGGTWGNVVVPDGEGCFLNGVTVQGSVKVGVDSDLYVSGGSIHGNLFASDSEDVETGDTLGPSHIYGNVSIDSSHFVFFDSTIDGNASFTGNFLVVLVNPTHIGGNVSITDNDIVNIYSLFVGGNLACSGNGTVNPLNATVTGHVSGQCAP